MFLKHYVKSHKKGEREVCIQMQIEKHKKEIKSTQTVQPLR